MKTVITIHQADDTVSIEVEVHPGSIKAADVTKMNLNQRKSGCVEVRDRRHSDILLGVVNIYLDSTNLPIYEGWLVDGRVQMFFDFIEAVTWVETEEDRKNKWERRW